MTSHRDKGPQTTTKNEDDPKPGSGFFRIDLRIWGKLTALGMNEAVAYLVLASGTGPENRSTSWSTNAVMLYAGMGWKRAKQAIDRLVAAGFVRTAERHTASAPRYELATNQEMAELQATKRPAARLGKPEQELLSDLVAGKQPVFKKERKIAEQLLEFGLIAKGADGRYTVQGSAREDPNDHFIWLPNTIATGTSSGEESPVRRLRSAGCIWTLRLFVDLYASQNLRDDGGISPLLIRQDFDRLKIGQQGPYVVWGFKSPDKSWGTLWWKGPFADHRTREVKSAERSPAWESIRLLESMGLLSFVPHIFENETDSAEPMHVYGIGGVAEAPNEREIGDAANEAGRAMALPSTLEEAEEDGYQYFCPILKTKPSARMIGVARLTYRPHTRRTNAWFLELQQKSPGWIESFAKLSDKGDEASFHRKANYA